MKFLYNRIQSVVTFFLLIDDYCYLCKPEMYDEIKWLEWKGFEHGVIACCGHGGKYNFNNAARCGATKKVKGKKVVIAKSCNDPRVRIIWDGIHYTEAANHWIFQQIANGSFSDPPVPLNMACHANASIRH